jgi:putative DNA primase/helicase
LTGKENYYSTIDNVVLILKHDPVLKKRFAKNLFEKREVALRDLPWRKVEDSTKYITDQDEASVPSLP